MGQKLLIALDRTQWGCINLLTIALIWHKRAIPLYWCLLPKLGSSNLSEQTLTLEQVLPLLKESKVIVLGDREFCSVDLANWPGTKGVSFCLRLKKNHLNRNRKLNLATFRHPRISTGNFFVFQRGEGKKNPTSSGI